MPLSEQAQSQTLSPPSVWRDIRVRFGLLLALALLPWLVYTALEAYSNLDDSRTSQANTMDLIAETTVREAALVLEAGMLSLDSVSARLAQQGCDATVEQILSRLPNYTALIVQEYDGTTICQRSEERNVGARLSNGWNSFDDTNQRYSLKLIGDASPGSGQRLVLQRLSMDEGLAVSLVLPAKMGLAEIFKDDIGAVLKLKIQTLDGRPILNTVIPAETLNALRSESDRNIVSVTEWEDANGTVRRMATRSIDDLNILIGVVRDRHVGSVLNFIDPFTGVLLPIFAWLVGFGLIWVGTQSMIIKPISHVRRATRRFANNKLGTPIRLPGSAAEEIHGLAEDLNYMARELGDRGDRLTDSLDEKDILMREIHHRVKNNLQIIISLLNMQERKAESEETIAAITETRARINAIAAVHFGLYESSDLRRVDLEKFVSRLIASLNDSLEIEERGLIIRQEISSCELPADSAIPVALFIVEAVSNSVEHGVTRGGETTVSVEEADDGALMIAVNDNGRGIGDTGNVKGVGTRLMRGFARQLGGTLSFVDLSPGLSVRLDIPALDHSDASFQISRKRAVR